MHKDTFSTSNINNIAWAECSGFKGGRDPLGIENSSITVYGLLLPGLTNLTNHIRYYSLYSWLLHEFWANYNNGNRRFDHMHQYNFIRRAELLIAYIMRHKLSTLNGVIGSDYTANPKNNGRTLAEGADLRARSNYNDSYWTWPNGAFGQYYSGMLAQLGIVRADKGLHYCNHDGWGGTLAADVARCVDADARDAFLNAVASGQFDASTLQTSMPLALDNYQDNDEWNDLRKMMLCYDMAPTDNEYLRKRTIDYYIEAIRSGHISRNKASQEFTRHMYNMHTQCNDDCAFGWYYYYICEAIHYAAESILALILRMAGEKEGSLMRAFCRMVSQCIIEAFDEAPLSLTANECSQLMEWGSDRRLDRMLDCITADIQRNDHGKAAAHSVLLLARAYEVVEKEHDAFTTFEKKFGLTAQQGIPTRFLQKYVGQAYNKPMETLVDKTVRNVMNDHIMNAYRKMGAGFSSLLKFSEENGRIVHIDNRDPQFTSPRLKALDNILSDLHLIS